jgi:hypothetical protein
MSLSTRPDGALDMALERLRAHGLAYRWSEPDLKVWESVCPACRFPDWTLRLRESLRGGPITLICRSGCGDTAIRAALERDAVEPRIELAIEIAEDAREVAARALQLLQVAA